MKTVIERLLTGLHRRAEGEAVSLLAQGFLLYGRKTMQEQDRLTPRIMSEAMLRAALMMDGEASAADLTAMLRGLADDLERSN